MLIITLSKHRELVSMCTATTSILLFSFYCPVARN